MAHKQLSWISAVLSLVLVLVSCGGSGGDTDTTITPPPVAVDPWNSQKLELLTGTATVDFDHCQFVDGAATDARFMHLMRVSVNKDGVYLADGGENCTNVTYGNGLLPDRPLRSAIRKVVDGAVSPVVALNYSMFETLTTVVRYPSAIYQRESDGQTFVLSYVAARSDEGYVVDESVVAQYSLDEWAWKVFTPGLFSFSKGTISVGTPNLVAGILELPPGQVDGQGLAAGFGAPHNLEVDASGLFHLIDQGRIRTIDSTYNVTTLDLAALGITSTVKALDADLQGHIHVLTQRGAGSYTWHRLADSSRLDFDIPQVAAADVLSLETFTVIGSDMLLGVRHPTGDGYTRLYRISAAGGVTEMSGATAASTPQDFLDQPAQYLLPRVQHIEYGVDGNLYLVLPQGVLVARNFT